MTEIRLTEGHESNYQVGWRADDSCSTVGGRVSYPILLTAVSMVGDGLGGAGDSVRVR